jgi:hypothetical protein
MLKNGMEEIVRLKTIEKKEMNRSETRRLNACEKEVDK